MKCNNCGTLFESKFCPNCGTPAPVQAQENIPMPAKALGPTNQLNSQANVKSGKKGGCLGCLVVIIAFLFLFALIGGILDCSKKSSNSENSTPATNATPTVAGTPAPTLTPKQSFVETIMKNSVCKEKTAANLYTILKSSWDLKR